MRTKEAADHVRTKRIADHVRTKVIADHMRTKEDNMVCKMIGKMRGVHW